MRIIISGGGTGGHIFPALAIAENLKKQDPGCEILFVGAEGKMEMERVPKAGFRIIGLPVAGLQRRLTLSNLALPFKIAKSLRMARRIIKEFRPDVVVGVGGYASAPTLWAAQRMSIPTLIQEQNSYAGLANKIIGKNARKICVAYDGMERFFPSDRIVFTGNPIRGNIHRPTEAEREDAFRHYSLDPARMTIFVVGGSLGSGTLNASVKKWIEEGLPEGENIQLIWQCGKWYKDDIDSFMSGHKDIPVHHYPFIDRMDLAYAAADLVISRSGAGTISELCIVGKPTIFVPSPNVTEDHQTHNAMALVNFGAGKIVRDSDAREKLFSCATALVNDKAALKELEKNILGLAKPDAGSRIAKCIIDLADKNNKR